MHFMFKVFRPAFVVALVALFVTGLAGAQNTVGKFTLPYTVAWGGAQLPPGNYTFTFDPTGVHWMELKNSEHTYFVRFAYSDEVPGKANSQLYIVPIGTMPTVHVLYLANRDKAFFFDSHLTYRVTTGQGSLHIATSAEHPVIGESIPVTLFGK